MESGSKNRTTSNFCHDDSDDDDLTDPITDIVEYLVRCAKISFKNAHVNESELRTSDKIAIACKLFKQSPTDFLLQFGKYLSPHHLQYFENITQPSMYADEQYQECIKHLKHYHSADVKRKRIRNRRYKALQKLEQETDYFSDKQMMFRNPLLYEQLVGRYLTDEEIRERDGVSNENLTLLDMVLETVDRNEMRQIKNEQTLEESNLFTDLQDDEDQNKHNEDIVHKFRSQWGEFETPDTTPSHIPDKRKQTYISAHERRLLREEFLQEMYSSFIEGKDSDIDYDVIDNDEQYDDLKQVSQDEEDKYFDSETNDVEHLEQHMKLIQEYAKIEPNKYPEDDTLDVFMEHLNKKSIQL